MKNQRVLTLGVLVLGCLIGNAQAQYNPYGYYPQPTYAPPPSYYNPYNYQPYYPAQNYGYMPQAQPYYAPPNADWYGPPPPAAKPAPRPVPATPKSKPAEPAPASADNTKKKPAAPAVKPPAAKGFFRKVTRAKPQVSPSLSSELKDPEAAVVSTPSKCAGGNCSNSSSIAVFPGSCAPHRSWQWYAQAGVLFLQPRWQDNAAFISQDTPGINSQTNFGFASSVAPRFEAGFSSACGLGARARYMYFDQSAQQALGAVPVGATAFPSSAAPLGLTNRPGEGDTALASSQLTLNVLDLEVTQMWRPNHLWGIMGSVGGRILNLDQNYSFTEVNADGTSDFLNSTRRFNGAGPTLALGIHRSLGWGGLGLYAIGRGSVLFGTFEQNVTQSVAGVAPFSGAASQSEEGVLPIGELEAGVEWSYSLGRCHLFVSAGVIGQVYFGAGNSSDSSPTFTGVVPPLTVSPNAQSHQDLGFLGLSIMAGIAF